MPGARKKEWLLRGVLLLVSLGVLEMALRMTIVEHGHIERLLDKPWYYLLPIGVPQDFPAVEAPPGAYRVYDPDLGWSHGALGHSPPLYFADAFGFRCSERDHAAQVAAGVEERAPVVADIVAIGDSFTHGDEVAYEDAWPAILARETGRRVLNLGVGGYGVDQAILRYEVSGARAPVVLLGLIAGDLERSFSQVYRLTGGGLKTKPIFNFEANEPRWLNRPAIHGEELRAEFELGPESPFFRRELDYDRRLLASTPFDVFYLWRIPRSLWLTARYRHPPIFSTPGPRHEKALAILEYGAQLARGHGARMIVVLLGNNNTFALRPEIDDPWALMRRSLEARGIEYLSTADEVYALYQQQRERVINASGVHYTPEANALVASILARDARIVDAEQPPASQLPGSEAQPAHEEARQAADHQHDEAPR